MKCWVWNPGLHSCPIMHSRNLSGISWSALLNPSLSPHASYISEKRSIHLARRHSIVQTKGSLWNRDAQHGISHWQWGRCQSRTDDENVNMESSTILKGLWPIGLRTDCFLRKITVIYTHKTWTVYVLGSLCLTCMRPWVSYQHYINQMLWYILIPWHSGGWGRRIGSSKSSLHT